MKTLLYWCFFGSILVQILSSLESLVITDTRFLAQKLANNNLQNALNNIRMRKLAMGDWNGQEMLGYNIPVELRSKLDYLMREENSLIKERQKEMPHISSNLKPTVLHPSEYYYKLLLPIELSREPSSYSYYDAPEEENKGLVEDEKYESNDEYLPKSFLIKLNNRLNLKKNKPEYETEETEDNNLSELCKLREAIFESEKENNLNNQITKKNWQNAQEKIMSIKKAEMLGNGSSFKRVSNDFEDDITLKKKRLKTRNRYYDRYKGVPKNEVINKIKSMKTENNWRKIGKRDNFDEISELALITDKDSQTNLNENIELFNNNEKYIKNPEESTSLSQDTGQDQWISDEANKNSFMSMSMVRKKRIVNSDNDDEASNKLKLPRKKEITNTLLLNELKMKDKNDKNETLKSFFDREQKINSKFFYLKEYKNLEKTNHKKKRSISSNSKSERDLIKDENDEDEDLYEENPLISKNQAKLAEAIKMIQNSDNNKRFRLSNFQQKAENKINLPYDFEEVNYPSTTNNEEEFGKPNKSLSDSEEKDDLNCFSLESLTTECSVISDIIPKGLMQKLLTKACNWYQICYSCGKAYGLLSSDCKAGFFEQTLLACNGLRSCQTTAQLILRSLRDSKLFYTPEVFKDCYRVECVQNYLNGYRMF